MAREAKLWKPFSYAFAFTTDQAEDRVVIFGLYSTSYNNQHGYLLEIETSDLLNMLNDYNNKIANLTAQEQIVLSEIVAKRYLANVDKLIHDEKMASKTAEIDAQEAEWTAKVGALASDRANLTTLAAKVSSETTKTQARIAELQAHIQIEGYNLSEAEVQVTEKEIQSLRVDVQVLETANQVLKIQLDTVNAGIKLVDADLKIARAKVDIENVNRDIARTDILEKELEAAQAQTDSAQYGKDVYLSRATIAEKRVQSIEKDVSLYESLQSHEAEMGTLKSDALEAEQSRRVAALEDRENDAAFSAGVKKDAADFDLTTATNYKDVQEAIDDDKESIRYHQGVDLLAHNAGIIEVATTLATANIETALIHTIKKSP